MTSLLDILKSRLIGQDEVLSEIAELLECASVGMRYKGQPIASVLALGPTGTGKSESSLIACEALYGHPDEFMARFDMSEYMITSALPNFLKQFEVKYMHTNGRGVILFDEIEKAHPQILDLLLQILSAARITLADGTVLNLSQYIIFGTSNIGARALMETKDTRYDLIRERTISEAKRELRPELLPRFDLLATFKKITDDGTRRITDIHVSECINIMRKLGHDISVSERALEYIRSQGYNEEFGVRPIRRAAMRIISKAVRAKQSQGGSVVGTIDFKPSKDWVGIQ